MLSVCYILKNEEEFLESSLQSVEELSTDFHFLDTGSTDDSLKILEDFQKRASTQKKTVGLYHEAWRDDFSWARNWVAEKARGPWVLFVDGDEILEPAAKEQIKDLLSQTEHQAFSLVQRNYSLDPQLAHSKHWTNPTPPPGLENKKLALKDLYYFENFMERLYRKDKGIFFEGRVHESFIPSCRRESLSFAKAPVILHHHGRLKNIDLTKKSNYYLGLSEKKVQEEPQNPAAWVEWVRNLIELKKSKEAFQVAVQAFQKFPRESLVQKSAIEAALHAGEFSQAESWLRNYLAERVDELEARGYLSSCLLFQGKFDEAEAVSLSLLKADKNNFTAQFNLGVIAFETKNWSVAQSRLEKALELKPSDPFIQDALRKIAQQAR